MAEDLRNCTAIPDVIGKEVCKSKKISLTKNLPVGGRNNWFIMEPKDLYRAILIRCLLDDKIAILIGLILLVALVSGSN